MIWNKGTETETETLKNEIKLGDTYKKYINKLEKMKKVKLVDQNGDAWWYLELN